MLGFGERNNRKCLPLLTKKTIVKAYNNFPFLLQDPLLAAFQLEDGDSMESRIDIMMVKFM